MGLFVAAAAPAGAKPPPSGQPIGKRSAKATSKVNTHGNNTHGKSKHWTQRNAAPLAVKSAYGPINESITLTPFPSQASATRHALAQNRRDRLVDAEQTARAAAQDDRWQTVLFHLRDLDARSDAEGCFWRLVAYYRLGQLERARQLRQSCELPSRDQAILEAEDVEAASIQAPLALAERDHPPAPVANTGPYAGAPPTRLEK